MPSELERTAVHEAGHAVVAVVLNFSVFRVSIVPASKWLGCAFTNFDWDWPADVMAVCYAGNAAEDIVFGGRAKLGDGDEDLIFKAVARIPQPGEHLAAARWRALDLVHKQLPTIREVARPLMSRKELDAAELAAALPALEAAA